MLSFVIMQTSCMMQKGQDMKADIIKIDGARRTTVKHTVIIADKQTAQLIRIYERLTDKQKSHYRRARGTVRTKERASASVKQKTRARLRTMRLDAKRFAAP